MYLLAHLAGGAVAGDLTRRFGRLSIDFRWVLLGAILPDLVDKPLGFALGIAGRSIAHTALAAVLLAVLGAAFARRGTPGVAWLSLGVVTHLALDRMWELPGTLLWPALGFGFPPEATSLLGYLEVLLENPTVWVGEIVGAIVLALMAWRYGVRDLGTLRRFLASGGTMRGS